jgi:hypothetical protein
MKYFLFALFLILNQCGDNNDDQVFCTEQYVYGLNVTLKDANTNTIISENITIVAKDESYEETLMNIDGMDSFFGAGERSGNYIIEVTSNSYQTYTSEIIRVDEDICHVIPESIEIILQPI